MTTTPLVCWCGDPTPGHVHLGGLTSGNVLHAIRTLLTDLAYVGRLARS